jgi:DNA-repair protein XRCC1
VLSGFKNPYRGELREKAMEMGAKYVADWNDSCTHLV